MTAPTTSPTMHSPAAPLRARRPRGRTAGALALFLAAGCLLGAGPAAARQTLRAFGHRAAIVTVDAAGHGVDTSHGRVAAAVTRFLIRLRPPRSGICPAAD